MSPDPKCITPGCNGTQRARERCEKCYRRLRRVEKGESDFAPGEVAIGASRGARELRTLAPGPLVKKVVARAKARGLEETEFLRRVISVGLTLEGGLAELPKVTP